jgi:hypothetical protein
MGLRSEYVIDHTAAGPISKEAQNMLIGNAVCPGMAEVLIGANPIEDEDRAYQTPGIWQLPLWPSREQALKAVL